MTNKLFYTKILKFAKKYKAIDFLGGKCEKCGENDIFKLCFHHINDKEKEYKISQMLGRMKWNDIEKEIRKCKLLCQNCHYELHQNEKITQKIDDKKIYLEFKGINGCEKCGYNKSLNSLHFHHIGDKTFEFRFLRENIKSIEEIRLEIVEELNKCQVLCSNCHTKEHSDTIFYYENIDLIKKKSQNFRKKSSKLDRNIIQKMYFEEGKKQIEIAKFFDCSKGTISEIIKKLKEYIANE